VVRLESLAGRQSRVLNASERGLMLVLSDPRPVGTQIRVTLYVGEPPRKIEIAGVIVHTTPLESADAGQPVKAGIYLTEAGPDWVELCQELAVRQHKK
jgi:hypothetical protein